MAQVGARTFFVSLVIKSRAKPSILIADDFSPWRARVREILEERPDWEIASEACDGQQAVQHAAELRPDIIILDVGMPVLNGLEAARQIRNAVPNTKIVFLTQYEDPEIRGEALTIGAVGYVAKANAASDLLSVIEAALRDRHRTSARLNNPVA